MIDFWLFLGSVASFAMASERFFVLFPKGFPQKIAPFSGVSRKRSGDPCLLGGGSKRLKGAPMEGKRSLEASIDAPSGKRRRVTVSSVLDGVGRKRSFLVKSISENRVVVLGEDASKVSEAVREWALGEGIDMTLLSAVPARYPKGAFYYACGFLGAESEGFDLAVYPCYMGAEAAVALEVKGRAGAEGALSEGFEGGLLEGAGFDVLSFG